MKLIFNKLSFIFLFCLLIVGIQPASAIIIQNFENRSFNDDDEHWSSDKVTFDGENAIIDDLCDDDEAYFQQDTPDIGVSYIISITVSWQANEDNQYCPQGEITVSIFYGFDDISSFTFNRNANEYGTDVVSGSQLQSSKTVIGVLFTGYNAKVAQTSFTWNCC